MRGKKDSVKKTEQGPPAPYIYRDTNYETREIV